uniref:(northern house mosquito) hypothetical protein n=1 Tax=Culex pipiens TaxID=7175 RepID=A0A8D8L1D7_CULPI
MLLQRVSFRATGLRGRQRPPRQRVRLMTSATMRSSTTTTTAVPGPRILERRTLVRVQIVLRSGVTSARLLLGATQRRLAVGSVLQRAWQRRHRSGHRLLLLVLIVVVVDLVPLPDVFGLPRCQHRDRARDGPRHRLDLLRAVQRLPGEGHPVGVCNVRMRDVTNGCSMQEHNTALTLLTRFALSSGAIVNAIRLSCQTSSPFEGTCRFLRSGRRFPVLLFATTSAGTLLVVALLRFLQINAVLPRSTVALAATSRSSLRGVVPAHAVLPPGRIGGRR